MAMRSLTKAPDAQPAKHGLVESGNRVSDGDGRWENGIEFTPEVCYALKAYAPTCPPADKSPYVECQAPIAFNPYMIEIGIVWNAVDQFDAKAIVQNALDVGTSSMLEQLIGSGTAGVTNPTLAAAPVVAAVGDTIHSAL